MPANDDLVERCRSGDRRAFEELFVKHRDMVFNAVWSISGDREQAEDITQETFVKAYLGFSGFRGGSKFSTWLYRIAVNQALRTKSTRMRRAQAEQPLDDRVLPFDGPEPEEALWLSETESCVRRAICELPPAQRAAITLRYLEGLELAEVAQILGSPVGTVKSRIHHALKRMSVALKDLKDV